MGSYRAHVDELSPANEQRRSLRRRQPEHPSRVQPDASDAQVRFIKSPATRGGESMARPLHEIAEESVLNWPERYFDAVPHIHGMRRIEKVTDRYEVDDGEGLVHYFLVNARTWRGEVAKRVKAELREML
jgi:hypothetical protein